MKTLRWSVGSILVTATFMAFGFAQTADRDWPAAGARNPKPEDAVRGIISAFDAFPIVAISDLHGGKDVHDFVLALLKDRAFPNAVNDIVVEFGNSGLQATLDRFIAGEDVPAADVRRLWRDESVPDYWSDSGFHAQLLQLVRRINQKLPPAKRLRVLFGEPAFDR